MLTPITTTRKILDSLNGKDKNSPWVVVPSLYTLTAAGISPVNGKVDLQSEGLILKVFINESTGEIKTYLAKFIEDVSERSLLS
jgi:hypothetical protein